MIYRAFEQRKTENEIFLGDWSAFLDTDQCSILQLPKEEKIQNRMFVHSLGMKKKIHSVLCLGIKPVSAIRNKLT